MDAVPVSVVGRGLVGMVQTSNPATALLCKRATVQDPGCWTHDGPRVRASARRALLQLVAWPECVLPTSNLWHAKCGRALDMLEGLPEQAGVAAARSVSTRCVAQRSSGPGAGVQGRG